MKFKRKEIAFIKDNYMAMTNAQLAEYFNIPITTMRKKLYDLGLKRIEMEYWTSEQVNFLKEYYQILGDMEIAAIFEDLWPKNKTWTLKHIEKKRRYLKLKRTPEEHAYITHRHQNRGLFKNANKTRWFKVKRKQGETFIWNLNGRPTQLIVWSGGSIWGKYEFHARIIWFLHYGPIPEGMCILHIDRDATNCDIANLRMVSNAGLADFNRDPEKVKETYRRSKLREIYGLPPLVKRKAIPRAYQVAINMEPNKYC
jgi:hypothetical protein